MNDRRKTLAAVSIIIGFLILVIAIVGILVSSKQTISPVPEESAIRIIFLTPTPTPAGEVTPTP